MTLAEDIEAAARRIQRTANGRRDHATASLADLLAQLAPHLADRIDNVRDDLENLDDGVGLLILRVDGIDSTVADHESRITALEP